MFTIFVVISLIMFFESGFNTPDNSEMFTYLIAWGSSGISLMIITWLREIHNAIVVKPSDLEKTESFKQWSEERAREHKKHNEIIEQTNI